MLVLKLVLVPFFLGLLTLAGRQWGPAVAGWLAGLPVVAGPILGFLAIEQGAAFAAAAAGASLSAVFASVSFSLAYAWSATRWRWPAALLAAMAAWGAAALLLTRSPLSLAVAVAVALLTLLAAPKAFPSLGTLPAGPPAGRGEIVLRMAAGAALTLAVTWLAAGVGARWSGVLAVFPVIGIVLAVFSHRAEGAAFSVTLLRATIKGLYAFSAFCLTLALVLPHLDRALGFAVAVVASLATQLATRGRRPVPLPA